MEEPIFAQIGAKAGRGALKERSETHAKFNPPTKAELEELRRLARPPKVVQECLELLYAALHVKAASEALRNVPRGGRLPIAWASVQLMLARFEQFFLAMSDYDIAPLLDTPDLLGYLSETYLAEGKLTEERVRRCSSACASLFRWCARSLARAEAALRLRALGLESSNVSHQAGRWRYCEENGWREYPAEVDALLTKAEADGQTVRFKLGRESYEADLAARVQRSLRTGKRRPIRPPGDEVSLRSIQGSWRVNDGTHADSVAKVRGTAVLLNGTPVEPDLESIALDGGRRQTLRWDFEGSWLATRGSPLAVIWSQGDALVGWDAIAGDSDAERS